jgi:ubiquinone/menaquinone biosynthesis C-methylase UbiE
MPAYYDTYDYPSYWKGREYEHESEIIAIKNLLKNIPKISTIVEIGAGYGRLVPSYYFRAKKIILSDPSARLLKMARSKLKKKGIVFIQSNVDNLHPKVRRNSADLVIMVRVLHHIEDLDCALSTIDKITKKGGYLILEFANKSHVKATISELLRGNFTFPLDISPKEVKGKKKRKKTIPFYNFHPEVIKEKLKSFGYTIISKKSVSNIRSPFMKKVFSTEVLIFIEKILQGPFSYFHFGPSVFILAKKK